MRQVELGASSMIGGDTFLLVQARVVDGPRTRSVEEGARTVNAQTSTPKPSLESNKKFFTQVRVPYGGSVTSQT